jgi:AraC-like DNA-binding protein
MPAVKQLLDDKNNADLKKIATTFSIGRNAIQGAVKEEYGVGVREYRLKKRMEQAKQMIEQGKEIKEIAFTLKYAQACAFSRAFKKYYGVAPTEWCECKLLPTSANCNLKNLESGSSSLYLTYRNADNAS